MAYVYRHIRLDKNEPFYIGIGNQPNHKRAYDYSKNRINKIWLDIVNKSEYEVEVLFDELSWEEACEKEKEFIALYGRKDLKTGSLANMTEGGDGVIGILFTDEHKRKIGEKSKGRIYSVETRKKMSNAQIGNEKWKLRTITDETKRKISEANKGRIKTEEWLTKMSEYRLLNGHPNLGKHLSEETKKKISNTKFKIPVLQMTLNGELIKEWESTKSVKEDGFTQSNVWRCCHNKQKTYKGYIWKFK